MQMKDFKARISGEVADFSSDEEFSMGDVYVFSTEKDAAGSEVLWAMFDRWENGVMILESSSRDLSLFDLWHELPDRFRYYRLTTREELKEYVVGVISYECNRCL